MKFLEQIKEWFYWHVIFPRLEYTRRNFDRKKVAGGTLYTRKKGSK